MSKDSLIKGTIILALAAFIARFLGLFQRVPLKHLLEDSGMATYGISYNIYYILLIIATAGIPSALSKLISERMVLGELDEAKRMFRAATLFAIVGGVVMTLVLYILAPFYAIHIARVPDSALAIRALAPALLLFPLIAIMRGYFQGRQIMMAGGLSQIVEQILRVITAVGLAYLILYLGYEDKWAIAGASFGGVAGSVGALAVMLYFWRKLKRSEKSMELLASSQETNAKRGISSLSYRQSYALLFKLSIPISLVAMAVPLVYLIDSSTVIALLDGDIGQFKAQEILGILQGRAQSLAGIPPILAIALSMSIVPVISSAYAQKNMEKVNEQASQALRIACVSGLPIVIMLCVAARPINALLFSDTEGTWIIVASTICAMFQIMMMTSGAVLLGLGKTRITVVHVVVGISLKLAGSLLLASWWGIYGIVAATGICFVVTMLLNFRELNKTAKISLMGQKWFGFLAAAGLMAGAGVGIQVWTSGMKLFTNVTLNFALQSILVCASTLVLYALLLVLFRVVTEEDILKYPAPLQKAVRWFVIIKK